MDASGTYTVTGIADYDGFVSKYSSTGEHLWSQVIRSPNYAPYADVSIDAQNNIYAIGSFLDSIDIDQDNQFDYYIN